MYICELFPLYSRNGDIHNLTQFQIFSETDVTLFLFSKFDMITKKIERKNSNTIVLNTKITNIPGISIKYRLNQLYFQNSKNKTICFKVPVVRWLFLKCICVSPKEFHFFEISLVFGNIYVKLVQGREIIRVMHWNGRCSFLVLSRSNGIKTSAIFHLTIHNPGRLAYIIINNKSMCVFTIYLMHQTCFE